MYCPNCGNKVGDNSKFCPNCGENLKSAIPAESIVKEEKPVHDVETPPEETTTKKEETIETPPDEPTAKKEETVETMEETQPETITTQPEEVTPEPASESIPEPQPKAVPEIKTPETTISETTQATYSLNEFASETLQKDIGLQTFELENKYLLDVNLDGKVWGKLGSMVAYTGNVRFKRQSSLEQGIDKFVKKTLTGESMHIMKIKGQGHVYLADMGKQITLLNLQNEKLYVNGNNILAFEEGIDWDIKMMTSGSTMMSGGLFNIKLQGTGMVAITTHYTPLTIRVTPDSPVMTDPHATVAWSSGLSTSVKMDVDFKTLLGKDSRETIQMKFKGDGFIIVQPYEE